MHHFGKPDRTIRLNTSFVCMSSCSAKQRKHLSLHEWAQQSKLWRVAGSSREAAVSVASVQGLHGQGPQSLVSGGSVQQLISIEGLPRAPVLLRR